METKNESQPKTVNKKLHALRCARQRDQWSSELAKAREERHLAELRLLRHQLGELTSERDRSERRAARVDALQQQVVTLTSERDKARRQAALVEQLQQQVSELTAERDAAHAAARRVEHLGEQLGEARAARDVSDRRIQELEASLATARERLEKADQRITAPVVPAQTQKAPPSRPFRRVATAAGVVLSVGVLASAVTFQNAQSTVQPLVQTLAPDDAFAQSPEQVSSTVAAAEEKKTAPETKKPRTRFARGKPGSHRQWGPPLWLEQATPETAASASAFDPLVKKLQTNLLTLGFDLGKADGFDGPRTERALKEFEALYLSGANLREQPTRTALAAISRNYADLAKDDARNFNVDRGVLAAIRLSSVRTGVEFSYLMKLAAVESNFDPLSKANGSSATGLYQFTRETWLNIVKAHGDKYGLKPYTDKIDYYLDSDGYRRPVVRDKTVYTHLLNLRTNPRLSAMMAAESVQDNVRRLTRSFDRKPSQADLYLTHFLGTDGAISFLRALNETPDALAVDMFPAAAQSNQDIFHPKTCKPRTVDEVYELFGQKFSSLSYDLATN